MSQECVTSIKKQVFHFTCPSILSIFIDFTFLVEIIFIKLCFYALLCMSRIMLPNHEIIIMEDGRAKRKRQSLGCPLYDEFFFQLSKCIPSNSFYYTKPFLNIKFQLPKLMLTRADWAQSLCK